MIICFSGTGNSLAVARRLANLMDDRMVRLEGEALSRPTDHPIDCAGQTKVIWVFPVYSWGVPPVVMDYIKRARLANSHGLAHYMVATCGDDAGLTHEQWRSLISGRGWTAMTAYTVEMPNTYTLMKGFDVDSTEITQRKLNEMPPRVEHIARMITSGTPGDEVVKGNWSWVKSKVIYPWFVRKAMSPKPFHYTDACVGCGECARSCPMGNIDMSDKRPRWHEQCALCLRCYHICPHHAVAYGKATLGKGQYINPGLSRPTPEYPGLSRDIPD